MTKTGRKYNGKPRHIEIHEEEEAENTHAQVTRGNSKNRLFKNAPKKVYRSMKGQGTVPIKEIPTKEEITHFWGALWENPIQHKDDTPLMNNWTKITIIM